MDTNFGIDGIWKVPGKEKPTRELFLEKIEILFKDRPDLLEKLQTLSGFVLEFEEERIRKAEIEAGEEPNKLKRKSEKYHTHSFLAGFWAITILEKLQEKQGENFDFEQAFLVVASALVHDLGAKIKEKDNSASPEIKKIRKVLQESKFSRKFIRQIIATIGKTKYDNEKNPAYWNFTKLSRYETEKLLLREKIVILSDLLQLLALDYRERVKNDLPIPDKATVEIPYYLFQLFIASVLGVSQDFEKLEKTLDEIKEKDENEVIKVFLEVIFGEDVASQYEKIREIVAEQPYSNL